LGNKGWLAPLLKACGVQILFTWKAAVIASVIVGFPLLVRSIRIGMEGIEREFCWPRAHWAPVVWIHF
jgi:molybdate transport system permease protein